MSVGSEQPRLYRPRMSTWWWLRKRSYFVFVMRELSGVFVVWFVVYLLLLLRAVGQGDTSYQAFLGWAATPWVVGLNAVTLAFVAVHTVTWFGLTPKAMVARVRGRRVPDAAVVVSQYAGLLVVSAFVWWLVAR